MTVTVVASFEAADWVAFEAEVEVVLLALHPVIRRPPIVSAATNVRRLATA
jgi:hypothetical protein